MTSLGAASDDPGSLATRAGSPSGHGGGSTAWTTRGKLSEGGRNDLVARYTVEPSPNGKRSPKDVGTALAEDLKVHKSVPGELWKQVK